MLVTKKTANVFSFRARSGNLPTVCASAAAARTTVTRQLEIIAENSRLSDQSIPDLFRKHELSTLFDDALQACVPSLRLGMRSADAVEIAHAYFDFRLVTLNSAEGLIGAALFQMFDGNPQAFGVAVLQRSEKEQRILLRYLAPPNREFLRKSTVASYKRELDLLCAKAKLNCDEPTNLKKLLN
jgi:hypothetical protein